jgi:hypothetical protein
MFASPALLTQRALLRLHLMDSGHGLQSAVRTTQGPYSQNESLIHHGIANSKGSLARWNRKKEKNRDE